MSLTIYGTAASRAARPLWVAQELQLAYEHIPLHYLGGGTRTPEFLAINPNGHIPVVVDDGVVVWESMACALYLADRFRPQGLPTLGATSPAEQAELLRWSFWAVTECEKDALALLMHSALMPVERRKPALALEAERRLAAPLRVLEQHLQHRRQHQPEPYLAGDRFTVADVCVASVLAWVRHAPALMAPCPAVQAWLARCLARPAYQAVQVLAQ
ncbi:MAG: glutathione S-transferase family protein [Polaromonas sp.]